MVKRFWADTYRRRAGPTEYPISRFLRRTYDASSTKMLDFLLLPLSLKVVRGMVLLVPSPCQAPKTATLWLRDGYRNPLFAWHRCICRRPLHLERTATH